MSKHTPGPWRAEFVGINDDFNNPTEVYEINTADGQRRICEYATAADARLIAAAPELLEALQLAYRHLNGGRDSLTPMEFDRAFKLARAAIAKATGDEQ